MSNIIFSFRLHVLILDSEVMVTSEARFKHLLVVWSWDQHSGFVAQTSLWGQNYFNHIVAYPGPQFLMHSKMQYIYKMK